MKVAASSGNLVDDILNGAYEDGGHQGADSLLEEDDHQQLEQDDFDHLNWRKLKTKTAITADMYTYRTSISQNNYLLL